MTPLLYALLSALFFTYGAAVLGENFQHYNPYDIGFIWYGTAALGGAFYMLFNRRTWGEIGKMLSHPGHSTAVLFFGAANGICWFLSLLLVGLSGFAVASRLSLLLLILYSFVILKERFSAYQMAFMGLMLCAVVLFSLGLNFKLEYIGYIIAIIGAVFTAAFTISKKHGAVFIHGMAPQMLRAFIIFLIIAAARFGFAGKISLFDLDLPVFATLLVMSGGLSSAVCGQFFRMKAFEQKGKLALVTLILNLSPVLIFLYGVFILGEDGNIWKYSGAIIMLISVVALLIKKPANKKPLPETGEDHPV